MKTPDFEHGKVYFKQFGTERVKPFVAASITGRDTHGCEISKHVNGDNYLL